MREPIMKKTRKETTSREGGLYMNSNRNSKKGKRGFKKLITGTIAVAIAVVLCVTMIPQDALAATDANTATKYSESLGDEYSTEYAGRIWTDKSVDTANQTYNNQTVSLGEGEDFLVTFSALATSKSVTGSASAPVDVVFVIDTSGSMDTSMGNGNRLYNAVVALNNSVKEVLSMNPNNRVGVIAFNSTSYELLPLDTYTQYNNNEYFTCGTNGSTITIRAKNSSGTNINTSHTASSGTNIQKGIAAGMNMLATEDSTTVMIDGKAVTRIPAMILLSDGQPSNASSYSTWWNINSDTAKMTPARSNESVYGMKALMTGAYMKQAIDVNYGLVDSATKTSVYTIGVGITGLWESDRNLAYVTLDPETYLNANNTRATDIRTAWNTYRASTTSTATLNGYTFRHPSSNLINNVADIGRITASDTTIDFEDIYYVDEYYPADSASDVTDVFNQIVSNITISTPEVPTEIKGSNPITDGYITYTDPIGEYMEVKNVKALIYDDVTFVWDSTRDTKTTSGNVTTYTFKPAETVNSGVYANQSVSNIIIEVTQVDATNQTMVVKVPAALVPVHVNTVTLNSSGNVVTHTHNAMNPLRVIYSVGLQDVDPDGTGPATAEAIVKNGVVDTSLLSTTYIANNKNEDGTINFYSNKYTGQEIEHMHIDGSVNTTTVGDTTVTFEPSHSNPFYYIQDGYVVYDASGNKVSASVLSNGKLPEKTANGADILYHYIETFYHGIETVTKEVVRTGAQLNRTELVTGDDGYVYRAGDSPRLNKIMLFEGTKADEGASTGTAKDFYLPTFVYGGANNDDAHAGYYKIYLGNNGVLALKASGQLEISKTVDIPEGLTPATTAFEFTVDFDGNVSGAFEYDIYDAEGNKVSIGVNTIADGGKITLSDGQKAVIVGLPDGLEYTVKETEANENGFTTDVAASTGDAVLVDSNSKEYGTDGKIEAGVTDTAAFVNKYSVTPVTYPTGANINGTKVLDGRNWIDGESYDFALHSYNGAPLPTAANNVNPYVVTVDKDDVIADTDNDTDTAKFDFGEIKFTEPGIYEYTVYEKEPSVSNPGMTYSRALYMIVVNVKDNGQGTLTIASSDVQKLYTDPSDVTTGNTYAARPLFTYDAENNIVMNSGQEAQDDIVFTNVYKAGEITRVPVATKLYVDTTGANPLTTGMFEFKFEPVGYYNGADLVTNELTKVPMPEGYDYTEGKGIVTKNEGFNVTFPAVTFEDDDIPNNNDTVTYVYKISEVKPATLVAGMTYDETVYYVKVKITNTGEHLLQFEATYYKNSLDEANKVTGTNDNVALARFTNTYDPDDAEAIISVQKTLSGREWKAGDAFNFTLSAGNEATQTAITNGDVILPNGTSITIADGTANHQNSFAAIKFNKVGTYVFNVNETQGSLAGINYDVHTSVVTVKVTDEGQGKLEADVSYADGTVATFTNTYTTTFDTSTAVNLTATKNLSGREIRDGEFFVLVDTSESSSVNARYTAVAIPASTTTDSNGNVTSTVNVLTNLVYTEANEDGYVYYISEQIPTDATLNNNGEYEYQGVTYDPTKYKLVVTVTDKDANGNYTGILKASQKLYVKSGNDYVDYTPSVDNVIFNNSYDAADVTHAAPHVSKELTGYRKDALKAGEFSFTMVVKDANNNVIVTETKTNNADGTVQFNDITFTDKGEYIATITEDVPADANKVPGITYSNNVLEVKYNVTDNGMGKLVATTSHLSGNHVFENVYTAQPTTVSIPVHKTVVDDQNNVISWGTGYNFTFEVVIADEATEAAKNDHDIEFPTDSNGVQKLIITDATANHKETGTITINKPGTYKFNVHEVVGNLPAVNYDGSKHTVTITAVDNGNGTISATYTVNGTTLNDDGQTLEFVNVYDPGSAVLSGHNNLRVIKDFTGREGDVWFDSDAFTFKLEAVGNYPTTDVELPTETTLTINNTNKLYAHFGDITFHKVGTYKFKISEVAGPANNGITYDSSEYVVTVEVTNPNNAGTLQVAVTSVTKGNEPVVNKEIKFNNTYNVEKVELEGATNLNVTKVLEGREWLDSDSFKFILEAHGKKTQDAVTATTVVLPDNASGITATKTAQEVAFGNIIFKEAGTYQFVIKEARDNIAGVSYDSHEAIITVTVTDDDNGNLIAAVPTDKALLTFTNTYTPQPASATFAGKKVLEGRSLLTSDEFTFTMEAVTADAPMPERTTITNNGDVVSFGTVQFTKEGTYEYVISEKGGHIAGIAYDSTPVNVTVVVTNNTSAGKLEAGVVYTKAGTDLGDEFVFTNVYTYADSDPVTIAATKKVTPTEGNTFHMEAGDFSFGIEASENNPASDPIAHAIVKNDENGTVFFKNAVFEEPGTYVYTIHEVDGIRGGIIYDDSVYTVTVVVTDDAATAKLVADVTITKGTQEVDAIVFDNTYSPRVATAIVHGHKHLLGGHKHVSDFEFNFTLTATNEAALQVTPVALTTKSTETGLVKFAELTFASAGTYTYVMEEVPGTVHGMDYTDVKHNVEITVTDIDGVLKADVVMDSSHYGDASEIGVFNNTYIPDATAADLGGSKKLDGRPIVDGEFEFALIDSLGDEVATTKNVGETFTFNDVPFTKAGTYEFTIIEKDTNVVGVTYDLDTAYAVQVDVADNAGKLEVTNITYFKDNAATTDVVFNNSYKAVNPATIQLGAAKTLTGRELKAGEFTFLLTGSDGTALTAVNGADGSVLFDELTFTEAGTYTYVISEAKGNDADVTYDGSKYTVTVVVKDDLKGNLVAEITSITESVAGKEIAANAVIFENAYTAPNPGTSPKTNDIFNIWMLLAVIAVAGFGFFGATAYSRRS